MDFMTQPSWGSYLGTLLLSALFGALVGAFFSPKARPFRRVMFIGVIALVIIVSVISRSSFGHVVAFIAAAVAAVMYLSESRATTRKKSTLYGSAEWANAAHLREQSVVGDSGLRLGVFDGGEQGSLPLQYSGDRHMLTVAPTRSGKGVSSIIPNLLSYTGSVVVIDPKGENAMITAARRGQGDEAKNITGLGQAVHVVDPWGITGQAAACFNPLDWLKADDPDISENAMMLADSIVVQRGGESAFWDEESKALLMGLLLYVALDAREAGSRTLGRVRDLIVMGAEPFKQILVQMGENANQIVSSTAARTASKAPELRASVMAGLQSHTHFLDSPRIRQSLARSDFRFEQLKERPTTVYLVLPSDRLDTFGRWLRLLIQQALTVNARNIKTKPAKPILFLLDEMPALGRLAMVEQAYGLMAGFGMQLWGIVQDLSQLERVYGQGWETFIGNSGVIQYFGSRDVKTADYFSKLCGVTTVEKFSISNSIARTFGGQGGGSESESVSEDVIARHLALPDELMVMRKGKQLLFIENSNPISARRVNWFESDSLRGLGVNLQTKTQP
jgi:type IV secretion system protein VirD4|tara:strand:+ start:5536 stop:7221 length:1686 start_codon:yes stop_codon:yes gene_type:complete